MVPKLHFSAAACDAASPRAAAIAPAPSPINRAQATAAPKLPMVPVAWNPAA
jgi:hypothetical protein